MPRLVNMGIPYGEMEFPDEATDADIVSTADQLEQQRQVNIGQAREQLRRATEEVERQQPSIGKTLRRAGLGIVEGAAGGTRQALGNLTRTYADIISPTAPVAPGSFRSFLQTSLTPTLLGGFLRATASPDPEAPVNILREAGRELETEGTRQLREAAKRGEQIGGGLPAEIAQGLATTAGASSPALLAAPFGLPVAAAAAGAQSYGNTVSDFRDQLRARNPGLSEEEAFRQAQTPAALAGVATGLLTRVFGGAERYIQQLTTRGLTGTGAKEFLRDAFKSASLELPEEFLDQLNQGLLEKAYVNPEKDVGQIVNDAALAGLSGFALGGLTPVALAAPVKAGEVIAERITAPSRMRRGEQLRRQIISREVEQGRLLPETGAQYAQGIGTVTQTTGAETGIREGAVQPIRVRQPTEDRLEAEPRAVQVQAPPVAVPGETTPQTKLAPFGGYNFGIPVYQVPGVRPGIMRTVTAQTAQQLGYSVPATVPSEQEWRAQGSPTGVPRQQPSQTGTINLSRSPEVSAEDQAIMDFHQKEAMPAYEKEFGGTSVQDIANRWLTDKSLWEKVKTFPGGYTRFMYALGAHAKTQEDVAALKRMGEGLIPEYRKLIATGNLDDAMLLVGTQPSEAYEFATGVKTDGTPKWHLIEKRARDYVPPVPDAQYLKAKALDQTAASPVSSPQIQAFAPINPQQFGTTDRDGNLVIDIPKLTKAVRAGQVTGGTASNAILLHLLETSDLHPLNPIKLVDQSPETVQQLNTFSQRFPASLGAYRGLFYTYRGSTTGNVEILLRNSDETPVSQVLFVTVLVHELIHNNVTSKLPFASPEVKAAAQDLFAFFREQSSGTEWATHNASSNVDEFFSEALSNPNLQRYLTTLDYSGRSKVAPVDVRNSAFGRFLEIIKSILRLPNVIRTSSGATVDIITALDEVVNVSRVLENVQRGTSTQQAASPAGPRVSEAQVTAGAAEVGRIADEVYRKRESGVNKLEGMAYDKAQFRRARTDLKRLADLATADFLQQGFTPDEISGGFPDYTQGVGVVDWQIQANDDFVGKLAQAGVEHTPQNVRDMQQEIYYETAASRYRNLRNNLASLQNAREIYELSKASPEELAKLDNTSGRLSKKLNDLGNAELNGRTVLQRFQEMEATEAQRKESLAQQQSLGLEPVQDFFGRQVGGYRDIAARIDAARKLAEALRDQATDPDQIKALTVEAEKWARIPQDIRDSIKTGKPLTDEQKASMFSALAMAFENFDLANGLMREMSQGRIPEINARVRKLLSTVADTKIKKGLAEVLIADVLSTLDGETGNTGTLQSQATTQELRNRISAIETFAMAIGKDLETNRQLVEWLADPNTQNPITLPQGGAYGVGQDTLTMILAEAKRNPAFSSSVLTLIAAANRNLNALPVTQLEDIEKLVKEATPESQAAAETIADDLLKKAKSRSSLAGIAMRDALRQIDQLTIERRALEEGQAMFNELGASPEFRAARDAINNSPFGLVEPMVPQNNLATTFKAFGAPGIPSSPPGDGNKQGAPLTLGVEDNVTLKSESYQKVARWHKAAQEHIDAYYDALDAYQTDPLTYPPPAVLGFDLPKIRGLQDAVSRFVPGSFLEISLLSENKRWRMPWLVRAMNKTAWFRQHDFVSKMVGGTAGTDLRGRLGDFVNHFQIAQSVKQKYSNIPILLHAALKSHPDLGMNIADYREHWNEMAHWGRIFGSPVQAGFVLPRSGREVTDEDVALLRRETAYEEELRRRVTETNPTQGVRLKVGERELVRPGAYVGDFGLPRHLNRQADRFIADAIAAYGEPAGGFDPTTDLLPASASGIVRFWNHNLPLVIQHVLDIRRNDRAMTLSAPMQSAELATAADWMVNGVPQITSLDDLVNQLVAHAPAMPGLNVRDQIINGLNSELRQYRDAAKRIDNERSEREQSRVAGVTVAFSADNEFTKPAAQLELPSPLYDYGALSNADHAIIASRANHERVIAYANALQRAIGDLQRRLNDYGARKITEQQAATSYGGNIHELKQVLAVLRLVHDDFKAAYGNSNPAALQEPWYRESFDLLLSGILALPIVGLRNMTQGQYAVYAMSKAMGLGGHRLTMWRAINNLAKTVGRFAVNAGLKIAQNTDLGASLLTGSNVDVFKKMAYAMTDALFTPEFRKNNERLKELGLDTREPFLQRMQRIWEQTAEFTTREEREKSITIGGRKLSSLAALPARALNALFDAIGVQNYDAAINASLLTHTEWLHNRLKEIAMVYGDARTQQGLTEFDATNPAFDLRPDEWSSFASENQNEDSLALFRLMLEGSANPEGFQLERALWNYYQQAQAGDLSPQVFTERQFDAVQRKLLADFNASTPANRSSAAQGNTSAANIVRNLFTLQGYASDGQMKLIATSIGGVRDRTSMGRILTSAPNIALLAFMAVILGYIVSSVTGGWERYVRGREPANPSPLDKDFWTSFKRWGEGTIRTSLAQLFYVGDLFLALKSQISGNKGFDPSGKIVPISMAQKFLNAVRGSYNTVKGSGTVGDAFVPLLDVARSMVPYWLETERAFGRTQGAIKQGERILRGEAQTQGLLEGRSGFTQPSYGPTTVVRRNLGDDVSRWYESTQANDAAGAANALASARSQLAKLEEFHYQKYRTAGDDEATARTKAQRDTWNDYQDINPVVSALLGKRPTTAQYGLLRQGTTGERGLVVDQAVNAWQSGAQALFNRQGSVTREDVAAARSGAGAGRLSPLVAGLVPRSPSESLLRRFRVSAFTAPPRLRPASGRSRVAANVLRSARRRGRPSLPRPRRLRTTRAPRVATVRPGTRRRRASGSRRRRTYA